MSGARPVAGGLGRVERSLKLVHSVPNRDAYGGCGGAIAPRGMDRCYRLYILLVSEYILLTN
jgi:hypothetical protein